MEQECDKLQASRNLLLEASSGLGSGYLRFPFPPELFLGHLPHLPQVVASWILSLSSVGCFTLNVFSGDHQAAFYRAFLKNCDL